MFKKVLLLSGIFLVSIYIGYSYQPKSNLGASVPTVVANFNTSLQNSITSTDTSLTLVNGTDKAGNTLSGYMCFTLDEGTSSEEHVCGTAAGTAVTGLLRGIDPQDGNLQVTALKLAHRRGGSVKITDFPVLGVIARQANGQESFPNLLYYNIAKDFSTASASVVVDKNYVDTSILSGCANSDTTTKGCVEMATIAEINAGVPRLGGTTAWLSVNPSYLASSNYGLFLPSTGQKNALAGSTGTPGASNLYITQDYITANVSSLSFSDAMDKIIRSDGDSVPSFLWIDASKLKTTASASGDLIVRGASSFGRLASAGADGFAIISSSSLGNEMTWVRARSISTYTTVSTGDTDIASRSVRYDSIVTVTINGSGATCNVTSYLDSVANDGVQKFVIGRANSTDTVNPDGATMTFFVPRQTYYSVDYPGNNCTDSAVYEVNVNNF